MKVKLKKLIKSWLVFIGICGLIVLYRGWHWAFAYFALGVLVLITVFILLGWDQYITYGDNEPFYKDPGNNQDYEDVDDYPY